MKLFLVLLLALTSFIIGFPQDTTAEPEPAIANLSYGPHPMNVLDFWKAEAAGDS